MDSTILRSETVITNTNREVRPIVLAADEAYAMPLATALRSIAESNSRSWPLEIHILQQAITEPTRKRIADSLPKGSTDIHWHTIDLSSFANQYSTLPHISKMTYARLLLPQFIPEHCKRVLYLDSDILVVEDLDRLWSADLEGAVVGAVTDSFYDFAKAARPGAVRGPSVKRYFNAGVLLVDVAKWRDERVSERALEYLDRFPTTPYSDQDALNFVCDGHWRDLSWNWNFQCDPSQAKPCTALGVKFSIVHFVANRKPWEPANLSPNAGFYDSFRSRTRFARTPRMRLWEALKRIGYRILGRSSLLRAAWNRTKFTLQAQTQSRF